VRARAFDPDAVRRLKADAGHDITVNGPDLAAHALRAGLTHGFLGIWGGEGSGGYLANLRVRKCAA
jgi:hypothetical protein